MKNDPLVHALRQRLRPPPELPKDEPNASLARRQFIEEERRQLLAQDAVERKRGQQGITGSGGGRSSAREPSPWEKIRWSDTPGKLRLGPP